jgi:multidrug efflux pump subunit AcrB
MTSFWLFFTKKRALSFLIIGALFLFGIFSAGAIQKESAPEVRIPIAIISSSLPGASPEDIEGLIIEKIEKEVLTLSLVKKVSATAQSGFGSVIVEFDASADLDSSIDSVRNAVERIKNELPTNATNPLVSEVNFADQPVIIAALESDVPLASFVTLTENIEKKLKKVEGVSRIEYSGVPEEEIRIIVQKESLISYGTDLQMIARTIQNASTKTPVGNLEMDTILYPIDFEGDFSSVNDIGNISLSSSMGRNIFLSDIAFIADDFEKARTLARVSKEGSLPQQAVTLFVYKKAGADITSLSQNVRKEIEKHNEENPEESIIITFDAGEAIINDLSQLVFTGMQTVLLVLLVLFLALGFREAFVASLSIPLSFLTALIIMYVTGNTINFISLFSLILAIGILVDTAIVMTEALHTNVKKGEGMFFAVKHSLKEFHYPVTTGNLTTVAVFFPLFTISGVTGEFIASIPFTIIAVLASSLFISLAFIPLIGSIFLGKNKKEEKENPLRERLSERLKEWYIKNIPFILDSRKRKGFFVGGLLFALILLISFPVLGIIKVSFFPQGDVDYLYINIEEKQGTPLAKTNLTTQSIEEKLLDIKDIASFTTTIGAESSFGQSARNGERFASIDITLLKNREFSSSEIVTLIEERLSSFQKGSVSVSQPNNGPPSGAPVLITFSGNDLSLLENVSEEAKKTLEDIEGTRVVESSIDGSSLGFTLLFDRFRAGDLGVESASVAYIVRTSVFGTEVGTLKREGKDIPIILTTNLNTFWDTTQSTNRASIQNLLEVPILNQSGSSLLLGSLLSIKPHATNEILRREDGERIVSVSSYILPNANAREISSSFEKTFTHPSLEEGSITMKIGGETEDVDQSFQDMFRALLFAMILVFAVLVLQFNSFTQAFIVLATVPLSLIGVLFGLFITGEFLSFPSMLGFIALSGVVVNNAIILVDVWNKIREREPEMSLRNVILKGGSERIRPILLTSITTVVGIFPLVFASDLWRPIAVAIIFGLLFAVFLTLVLVPVLYMKLCKKI